VLETESSSPTFASISDSSLTPGSVVFSGTGGLLSQNNSNLFWDNSNLELGIGTSTPSKRLHLAGTTSSHRMQIDTGINFSIVPNLGAGAGSGELVADAAGLLSVGVYRYTMAYYTALGQTTPNVEVFNITTDATHKKVLVTLPISTDYRVVGRKLYRSLVDQQVWTGGLVIQIANNTQTQYTDNTPDGSLGANNYFVANGTNSYFVVNDTRASVLDPNLVTLGPYAGGLLTTGGRSVFVGPYAGYRFTTTSDNTALGYYTFINATSGSSGTAVGTYAGYSNTNSTGNTYLGSYCGFSQTSGTYNTFLGSNVMANQSVAARAINYSTMIGYTAGYGASGDNQIFIGYKAGAYETAASKLMVDAFDRSTEAAGRTGAILYGVMSSTAANQTLTVNASLGVTSLTASKLVKTDANKVLISVDGGTVPVGAVMLWPGTRATIPSGWQECDGTNGTPDYRAYFVRGAATSVEPSDVAAGSDTHCHPFAAGTNTASASISHTHTFSVSTTANACSSTCSITSSGATAVSLGTHTHSISCSGTTGSCDPSHCHSVASISTCVCSVIPVAHKTALYIMFMG
jgi:hypothetical protein